MDKNAQDISTTPLDLFIANENETSFHHVATSTPRRDVHEKQHEDLMATVRNEMEDIIEARVQAAVTAIQQNYEQRLSAFQQRITDLERQLRGREQHVNEDINYRFEELQRQISGLEEQVVGRNQPRARVPPRPENVCDIVLTPQDIKSTHDYDSEHANLNLPHDVVTHMKDFSKSKRIFVANLTRKMFSMEERARDVNVAGSRNRPPLSPLKTRYRRICNYVAQQYNCAMDSSLQTEVRKVIDDTNRRYRDDLKLRKHREQARAGASEDESTDFVFQPLY